MSTGTTNESASAEKSDFVIAPEPIHSVEVAGTSKRFPVRRVYCVSRNYSAHAVEMGDNPDNDPPFYFSKPASSVYAASDHFPYPEMSEHVGYEVEMVVALKSGGKNIAEDEVNQHIYGYAVGLDMTRRDLQDLAKEKRRPWDAAKGFESSAPCGPIYPVSETGIKDKGRIWLQLNDVEKQNGELSQMRWSVPQSISILSQYFELSAGDLIFTGTPEGVGPVQKGDVMKAGIEGLGEIEVHVI
jgi:fumarylpyruvate hydrolase